MTDRPILFSGPMVRAILEGRKTQTRRVLKPQPDQFLRKLTQIARIATFRNPSTGIRQDVGIPIAPGDRLWVREAWRTSTAYDDLPPRDMGGEEPIQWEADHSIETWGWSNFDWCEGRFRQGMHMPRWASRLTLTVTDVRVQRLQDITDEDARAEGVTRCTWAEEIANDDRFEWWVPDETNAHPTAWGAFWELWDGINARRGFGWDANPWVVAYTFTVHHQNIDQMEAS